MKKNIDLSLYLVTDRKLSKGRSLEYIIEQAVKGGVTMVQLREKDCSTRKFYELAVKVKNILKDKNIPLIINDRLDIALAVEADGLHIGQSDMPYEIARQILGADAIIGLSVENLEQAIEANKFEDLDYIGLSPVFSTPTKTDINTQLGLQGIRDIAKISKHKMVGIGGINFSNAKDIINAGAHGISVVSAICSADDPYLATKKLKKQVVTPLNNKNK